jgi:uridine monophosphate synthetase
MPGPTDFFAKLHTAALQNQSLLCVGLDPQLAHIPSRFRQAQGDPLAAILAWNSAIIEATHPYVCVYKPNIAFYEALGLPGLQLLRATLDLIPAEIPVLLDAKRGDMGNTAVAYAQAIFEQWQVDAVTLSPYLGRDSIEPYLAYPDKGLFILCHTSNPGAADFQEAEVNDWRTLDREPHQPLYVHVARTVTQWSDHVGLVVGATFPEAIRTVRAAAPDAWFLVPGIGAQQGDLAASVRAGLRADGMGVIISASRSIAHADHPGDAARQTRDEINTARQASAIHPVAQAQPTAPHAHLIEELVDLAAVKFGDFLLASGRRSPIYIDLRLLVSRPALLAQAAAAYAALLAKIPCDRIAGVPYAALPIATAVALQMEIPLIYPRKEVKAHGLGKEIEGNWQAGERVVIIEDLITSGGSTIATAERLRAAGLIVEDVIVLIDREQGGVANLHAAGLRAHSVFTLSAMLDHLERGQQIDPATAAAVRAFLQESAPA